MTSERVLVFGGTTEGREICDFLKSNNIPFTLSVATPYGKAVSAAYGPVSKPMEAADIKSLIEKEQFGLVIDATHPYARTATENIQNACVLAGAECLRVVRGEMKEASPDTLFFETHQEAADYLNTQKGNILLAIGVKEIGSYTGIKDFQDRIYPRVLPMASSIEKCISAGYKNAHLICMQGPFSVGINVEMIKMANAAFLVTKDSGREGGMAEKLEAAEKTGIQAIVIARPVSEKGYTVGQLLQLLKKRFSLANGKFPLFLDLKGKKVTFVGGGKISLRRIKKLLACGARIIVISPEINGEIEVLNKAGLVDIVKRGYQEGDLQDCFLAVAATNSRDINRRVSIEAKSKGILANIADCSEESDFWFPATAEAMGLTAGVISLEKDHIKAKKAADVIKQALEDHFEA